MDEIFDNKYYFRFPWLNGSQKVLFDLVDIDPTSISLSDSLKRIFLHYPSLKDRILKLFEYIGESKEEFPDTTDLPENLAMYPILQILIQLMGNRVMGNALRNIYSKDCYEKLKSIRNLEFRGNSAKYYRFLMKICHNLGFDCEQTASNFKIDEIYFPFRMKYVSYLKSSSIFKDSTWKLINRYFQDGYVYMMENDLVMFIRQHVNEKTKPDYSPLPDPIIENIRNIEEMKEIEDFLSQLVINRQNRFKSSLLGDDEIITHELFAPCIQFILFKLAQGENLSHNERLAIAFYYLNTNHNIEDTVDLFRTSPDFDEGIARYQVEFAAGKKGKGTKYGMYSCKKLKSLHMCQASHPKFGDKLCVEGGHKKDGTVSPIRNPAGDYIFWKKVKMQRLHDAEIKAGEKIVEKTPKLNTKGNAGKKMKKDIKIKK